VLRPRLTRIGLLVGLAGGFLTSGCATERAPLQLPMKPPLPAVNYVKPCDPSATVGLTPEGVDQLRARDEAWRAYVHALEATIHDAH